MPSYSTRERLTLIARYLYTSPPTIRHSVEEIARTLDIPTPSIRRTMRDDYPVAFKIDPNTGGWTLSGNWPEGIVVDLNPPAPTPTNERVAKLNPKYYDDGVTAILSHGAIGPAATNFLVELLQSKSPAESTPEYWEALNVAQAWVALLKIVKSPDRKKKLQELVRDGDSTGFYKFLTKWEEK